MSNTFEIYPKYMSKEDKAWNKKIDELLFTGKASSEQEAEEILEMETEQKKLPPRKDVKTGVA